MPAAGIAPPDDGVDLSRTLADATPAFARKPIPVTPDMSSLRRLILALADATPAFVPDFDGRTPRQTGRRPWYRQPATLLVALGILLGLSAAALIVLPGHTAAPFSRTTQTTKPPSSSEPTTSAPAATTAATATETPTVSTTAAVPPFTTTVTATDTTTVTTTVPTPTVTSTVPTTTTVTVTSTVTGPPVTVTTCANGHSATSPASCRPPSSPSVH